MALTKIKNSNLNDPDLVTLAEDGVTSGIQTLLNGKESADASILKTANIGSTVQAYYATGYESLPILKSVNYTAVVGDSILVTAGSVTITLPGTPSAGDTVIVKDGTGAADTTNWTVGRNGSNIASSATDLTFDKNWVELCMTYVNASIGWSV